MAKKYTVNEIAEQYVAEFGNGLSPGCELTRTSAKSGISLGKRRNYSSGTLCLEEKRATISTLREHFFGEISKTEVWFDITPSGLANIVAHVCTRDDNTINQYKAGSFDDLFAQDMPKKAKKALRKNIQSAYQNFFKYDRA